ncbi:hypothetical protein LEP1GSC016_1279 [Leptospira borgpetersenii serovar Hardjo-bovis str. Sponselee]|uniref:Uncharacterized protein n=2 Tax=Leptospira borgpetersenii TaxID=174 RepID=M6BW62_LEPBO|nr:hypothetical protein LEP1GSC016_1279 [Leptospira borgpetersenii serovar Hardjo-bovis str. Sponselee]EMO63031.1 hypothetical protein LEP1GSC133_4134 [Leptospira borgpetersenii serovar Pomona str. 200901868]
MSHLSKKETKYDQNNGNGGWKEKDFFYKLKEKSCFQK